MSRPGDLFGDMPTFPPTFDPARDEDLLATLLSGAPLPPDAPVEARLVTDLFAAMSVVSPAEETAGLEAARRAFRTQRARATVPGPIRLSRHRVAVPATPIRPRLVAASIVGVLGLGGFATAAFAGVLPEAMQTVAHRLVGAPSPERTAHGSKHAAGRSDASTAHGSSATGQTTGPDATGPAAVGLCTAYDRSRTGDRAAYEHSVAYTRLVLAAGSSDKVATFCDAVPHPSASGSHPGGAASGKPSSPGAEGERPPGTGRPSDAPSHPTHPKTEPTSTSGGPTSEPPASRPVVPPHPTHTKTAAQTAPSPHAKGVGSTRSPH